MIQTCESKIVKAQPLILQHAMTVHCAAQCMYFKSGPLVLETRMQVCEETNMMWPEYQVPKDLNGN